MDTVQEKTSQQNRDQRAKRNLAISNKFQSSEKIIKDLLNQSGVEVGGIQPWDIRVHDDRFYKRILRDGSLALGESYVDGWWDCENLDQFIDRTLRAGLDKTVQKNARYLMLSLQARILNFQNIKKATEVGERHYDIGNDLYQAMLDKRMQYTCAYWKDAKTLDQAQENKLKLVCEKIQLKPGMKVLELGCGWGGFARYASENYDAEITGVTVSKEQVSLGMELCRGLPVSIKKQDYRTVTGQYDAVVSIGIMEHIGYKNYRTYMEVANRCMKDDGIAFIHTIGANVSSSTAEPFTHKYIFPNGMLPSISQIGAALEDIFVMEDWHNFGPDYDRTLMAWDYNFKKAWPQLKEKYGERFYRMWEYYLLTCAGAFRARDQQLWQIILTKKGRAIPSSRRHH